MKAIGTVLTLLFVSSFVAGQAIPDISIDSTSRTSEFYAWTYKIEGNEHGFWGRVWQLDHDLTLHSLQLNHHPVTRHKQMVGSWKMQNDSVILMISKPKKLGLIDATTLKYKPYCLQWTINTGFTENGKPLVLRSVAIIFSDDPKFSVIEMLENLKLYVRDNYKATQKEEDEQMLDQFGAHEQIVDLVGNYFILNKMVAGIRTYKNQNVWLHGKT
jgi:hypothetical protein